MNPNPLLAISPLDGRYSAQVRSLIPFFSEYALIRYRIVVEVEYLIAFARLDLKNCPPLPDSAEDQLRHWARHLDMADAEKVKQIERTINHDVKAVEYRIKEKLEDMGLSAWKEFVHFGLTSQDINNTAIPLSLMENYQEVVRPALEEIREALEMLGEKWKDLAMLSRTHGQPASPTRFGKEMLVFEERLRNQISSLDRLSFGAKFGGATGGFNAHHVAYPDTNWVAFGNAFVKSLGLERQQFTTQIEHYDGLAAFFDGLSRTNTLLIDFCRDIWQYISMDYLKQKIKAGEVGSSAMPHKVNPIDFENGEGNLGMANALFHHFSSKLPISRLQRDLSDSTVLRNIGVPIGHSLVAYQSIGKGMAKIEVNEAAISEDLGLHPEVLTEAIQTVLRREGYPQPYEALKNLSRKGSRMKMEDLFEFIQTLAVSKEVKEELLEIRPENYIGLLPPKRAQ
jgi:adenylosuccinate lyase